MVIEYDRSMRSKQKMAVGEMRNHFPYIFLCIAKHVLIINDETQYILIKHNT